MVLVPLHDAEEPGAPGWWLLRLGRKLKARRGLLDVWQAYHDGDAPLPVPPKGTREAFTWFQEIARTNLTEVVTASSVNRLRMIGITDENGDPERAEFIRVQCALAAADALTQHEVRRVEFVGPQVGRDLQLQALYAVVFGGDARFRDRTARARLVRPGPGPPSRPSRHRRRTGPTAAESGPPDRSGSRSRAARPAAPGARPPRRQGPLFRISLAEWSLHRTIRAGKLDNLEFPPTARTVYGLDAVEYVNTFFKDQVRDADYLVIESTYGNRKHASGDPEQLLAEIIVKTAARGGSVLIPSFAVGRAQALLFHLSRLKAARRIPEMPIYLDSPMAGNASEIFCAHLGEHALSADQCRAACNVAHYVKTAEESKALNAKPMPKVIVSASGMATGGRVLHHLKWLAPEPRNTLLFPGFQAPGTRGDAIVHVRAFGN